MAEKEPVSESSGVRIIEESGVVEEGSSKPAATGVLSVVYADGLENPPRLTLSGAPGVPKTLLVVDESGTPVARYTAGQVSESRLLGALPRCRGGLDSMSERRPA